jgi:MFS family permease
MFYTGITAVWGFAGILGEAWGLNQGQVATAVSVSLGAGLVGALVAGLLADRVRALSAILFGVLGLVATYALLGFQGSYSSFLFLLLAMNCLWNVCVVYQAAMVASFDVTGRFTILMTAGQMAGAILGPGLMGLILDSTEGFIIGLGFASVWLIASYGMFWKAGRSGDIPSRAD